jgi:hypothetical protein
MADNYLCYLCNKEFPTNAAVDGYAKGYSRGLSLSVCLKQQSIFLEFHRSCDFQKRAS